MNETGGTLDQLAWVSLGSLVLLTQASSGLQLTDSKPVLQASLTTTGETPAPSDIGGVVLVNAPTGQTAAVEDELVRLFHEAARHVANVALLPVDEGDEKIVDDLLRRQREPRARRPMKRRAT